MVSSGAMRPARAPPSIDMLQIVMRWSIESASIADPRYSKTWPVPPPTPIRDSRFRITSFALTPGSSCPSTRTSYVFGRRWSRHCVARTISTSLVPMPNASAPNAPWVDVCESPHTMVMPGWVSPSWGPMTWTIPWLGDPRPWSGMPNSAQFAVSWSTWAAAMRIEDRQVPRRRRHRVVGRRDGPLRVADRQASSAQAGERLRAGDLVDEVQVDGEHARSVLRLGDDVVVPDLVDERARLAWHGAEG